MLAATPDAAAEAAARPFFVRVVDHRHNQLLLHAWAPPGRLLALSYGAMEAGAYPLERLINLLLLTDLLNTVHLGFKLRAAASHEALRALFRSGERLLVISVSGF